MKVALVDVNYNFGSTGKIVANLVAGLTRNGHIPYALYGRGGAISDLSNVRKISSTIEVLIHAFATRVTGHTDGFSPLATSRLMAELDYFQPDVVHLHDIHGYFIDIAKLVTYLKRKKIPTVWTFHCEFMYTGRCGYAIECERWKAGCYSCPDLSRYPKTWFFDFASKMFIEKQNIFSDFENLHLVAPSEWLANRMRQSLVGSKKIQVISNGLDTDIFCPRNAKSLKDELHLKNEYCVLSVGDNLMSSRKGGHWVVDLARRFLGENVVFVMVGVDNLPSDIPRNIRMLSRVASQDKLAELYSLGDILLLPSEKETFSMVAAESLACGLPVVGFDCGAPKEIAPEGYGIFVPHGDLNALEELVRSSKSGQTVFKSSLECVEFAKEKYSHKAMVDGYQNIYIQAVNSL